MINEWLRRKLTIEEAEAEHLVINDIWPEGKPFGFIADQWQKLITQMQPSDEIWEYRSDDESWQQLMGWEGIALVREGVIIDSICTGMN